MNKYTTQLFDLKIFNKSKADFIDFIEKKVTEDGLTTIFTPNAEQIVQAEKSLAFKKNLQQADVLIPDGMSLVWASRLLYKYGLFSIGYLVSVFSMGYWVRGVEERGRGVGDRGKSIEERITGVDVARDLLILAEKNNWRALVVGGRDLGGRESGFIWIEGYQDIVVPTKIEEEQLTQFIKKIKPQIVFVAFGAPFQEKWIVEHHDLLEASGVKVVMVVGGAFDFITGKISRAPWWMQKVGLEWLFRLIQEPWRWKRQLRLLEFWKIVFKQLSI